jgi:hypothetical protein
VVARLLAGAWRSPVVAPELSEADLAFVIPHLLASGTTPLAWRALRGTPLEGSAPGHVLHDAHAAAVVDSVKRARIVVEVATRLRATGIEAVIGKGWAASLAYPHPALRPHGDVDVYVEPARGAEARAALPIGAVADVHRGVPSMPDRPWPDLLARSVVRDCAGTGVRVFGPEDHLRLLAIHMLGHGAWRPLWLCDLAAAVETRPPSFDWDLFLSGEPRRTDWVVCALRLAEELLGASLEGAPERVRRRELPRWLRRSVIRQWSVPGFVPHGCRVPLAQEARRPSHLLIALRQRWPNPIEATVGVGGAFDARPRLPYQLAECAARTLRFVRG